MRKADVYPLILFGLLLVFFFPIAFISKGIFANYCDTYLHYYPLKYLVSEHLISGKLPLWNPYIFSGQPLLANPQSAIFYPFSILFCLLPLPAAFNYFVIVHFILAGSFMYLLLRSQSLCRSAAIAGSTAFTYSSFLVYQVPAGHPVALSGYVWLPLLIMLVDHMRRTQTLLSALLTSLALTLQFLSGHTFPFYITAVYIAFHFLYNRCSYWKSLVILGASFILFASVQLIPSMELSSLVETGFWPELVKYYSFPAKNLINLLLPNYYGNPIDGSYLHPESPSYFFELHGIYAGLIPLLLALAGIVMALKKRRYYFPLLFAFGILLSFGFSNPLYSFLYNVIPGLSYLRVPARFIYLSIISLVCLASYSWDIFLRRSAPMIKIIILLVIAADLFWWGKRFITVQNMDSYRRPSEISGRVDPLYRIITEPDTLAADKSMLYHHFNANGYEAILLKDFTRLLGLQEKKIFTTTGLARTDLHSPLGKALSVAYIVSKDDTASLPRVARLSGGLNVYRERDPLPRISFPRRAFPMLFDKDHLNEMQDYLRHTSYPPQDEIVLAARTAPRVPEGGTVLSYLFSSDRIIAEAVVPAPGVLLLTDTFYPGWHAVAGRKRVPVYRADLLFRALLLPAGSYTGKDSITFWFDPLTLRLGLWITLFSLAAAGIYAGSFLFLFMKKPLAFDKPRNY